MLRDKIEEAMRQAVANAERGAANPEVAVLGRFRGLSTAGTVTVWVDALGRLDQLELAPDSVLTGDEEAIASAVMEAYRSALTQLAALSAESLAGFGATDPSPRQPRPDRDDTDTVFRDSF